MDNCLYYGHFPYYGQLYGNCPCHGQLSIPWTIVQTMDNCPQPWPVVHCMDNCPWFGRFSMSCHGQLSIPWTIVHSMDNLWTIFEVWTIVHRLWTIVHVWTIVHMDNCPWWTIDCPCMDNCPWAPMGACMGIHKIVHACISPCTLIQVVVLTELDTWSIGVLMPMQVSTFQWKFHWIISLFFKHVSTLRS